MKLGPMVSPTESTVPSYERINIFPNTIFDNEHPKTAYLHKLANNLHITTKRETILRNLPINETSDGASINPAEAERVLRGLPFLRDASVSVNCQRGRYHLQVHTWDNWSLQPSVSFGRKGGKQKSSVGIEDDNLLGLGIGIGFDFAQSDERSSYTLNSKIPLHWVDHGELSFRLSENSDGFERAVRIGKPFYSLDSRQAYEVALQREERIDKVYQNGELLTEFSHHLESANLEFGWSLGLQGSGVHRWRTGLTLERDTFEKQPNFEFTPEDRSSLRPWLDYTYIENHYSVLRDVNLISEREDLHSGWQHNVRLAYGLDSRSFGDKNSIHYELHSRRSIAFDRSWLSLGLNLAGHSGGVQNSQMNAELNGEYLKRLTSNIAWYNRLSLRSKSHASLDDPLVLGGDSGLRAYPLQYQHGSEAWLASSELRLYPEINLFQIIEVGAVAFVDVGQARGEAMIENELDDVLASVGVGARLFSSHSSGRNVVHIDLAHPLVKGPNVPDWEWRVQVKRSF